MIAPRDRTELGGSFVFAVILTSVVVGALAGLGYLFFSQLIDGWGLAQHDLLALDVELFGNVLVEGGDSLATVLFAWYGYMTAAPVIGAATGAVMALLAIDARRGAIPVKSLRTRPAITVSAAVLLTASVTGLYVYPVVQSFLPMAYMLAIGGSGLLAALLWCPRRLALAR